VAEHSGPFEEEEGGGLEKKKKKKKKKREGGIELNDRRHLPAFSIKTPPPALWRKFVALSKKI
jgi:hypothetical protein